VRNWIIASGLCIFCFVLPLQIFIIGNDTGIGIQGAVYRYQLTTQGDSLIPITREIWYVTSGMYNGRSAFSVILWVIGTIMLVFATIYSLICGNLITRKQARLIIICLTGAGIGYLASCIAQYGLLLNGPAGRSIPLGVFVVFAFVISVHYYFNGSDIPELNS
jgi:hypothetical protein